MTADKETAGRRHGTHQPPFPYWGGKSAVADLVWQALGDVPNYVEAFAGSCAVLLLRPGGAGHVETVNDADGLLSNFWRALRADPDAVADWADGHVDECDLHAKHLWLNGQRERITERLMADMDFYDAKAAGWWCWGSCVWIGSGWCSGKGPWQSIDGVFTNTRQLPHLGNPGKGVNRQLPHLGDPGTGECELRHEWLVGYLRGFADRLRNVRVCCGDWHRVCGPSVTTKHGLTGLYLDPPYADTAGRASDLYAVDCLQVAHDVRDWSVEHGSDPLFRIVLSGYESEHEMPADWRVIEWKTAGGYGLQGGEDGVGRANAARECLWLSPHCLAGKPVAQQGEMFKEST